jgi:hypothetical protein
MLPFDLQPFADYRMLPQSCCENMTTQTHSQSYTYDRYDNRFESELARKLLVFNGPVFGEGYSPVKRWVKRLCEATSRLRFGDAADNSPMPPGACRTIAHHLFRYGAQRRQRGGFPPEQGRQEFHAH